MNSWILGKNFEFSNFYFLFHFAIIFYSLSSLRLPAQPLYLIVLHNGKKKHSCEKSMICDVVSEQRICLSETRCHPHETFNSNLQIPGYISLHQTRKNWREGRICIFLLESLFHKVRDDLAVNFCGIKCFCVEVFNKNLKGIVLNLTYRPPNGDPNELENYFKNILSKR